jgi:hypothetical protein
MWLSTSLKFDNDAMKDFIRERIDGPALLALNDVLVGRLESLTVKHCIDLLNAVEQLKVRGTSTERPGFNHSVRVVGNA